MRLFLKLLMIVAAFGPIGHEATVFCTPRSRSLIEFMFSKPNIGFTLLEIVHVPLSCNKGLLPDASLQQMRRNLNKVLLEKLNCPFIYLARGKLLLSPLPSLYFNLSVCWVGNS